MKASSLNELKRELENLPPEELLSYMVRLAKYKKENKELLSYLLFYGNNENEFISKIKDEINAQFSEINKSNIYYAKKSIRKILRMTRKYIKFSGSPQTEVELLMYFLLKFKSSGVPVNKSLTLTNLFRNQRGNLNKALSRLHEDLQYDYMVDINALDGKWQ